MYQKFYRTIISNRGFSTLEMLISMALIVLVISYVIPLASGAQSSSVSTETNQEALYKARDLLEEARATAFSNFSSIVTTAPVSDDIYTKNINVTDIDLNIKKVNSHVSWNAETRNLSVNLTTILTDIDLSGDTCNPNLTGDWADPQLLGAADIGENNGATDIKLASGKAYATANPSAANKEDFYIIDVTDKTVLDLPIWGGINTGNGLASVDVFGQYAYVANMSTGSQLQVINVVLPISSSSIISNLDVTASGDTAVGNSVFYYNDNLYLGLDRPATLGGEFFVIDVTNPSSPNPKASFEVGTKVNDIIIKDNIAYLAVPDNPNTSSLNEQLIILDLSQVDFGTITQINTFGPNPITMSGKSLYLSKDGNTLYLGEGGANPSNDPQFFSINVDDPNNISQITSKYVDTANDVTVREVIARSNLAFMVTSDPNKDFQVWDLNDLGSADPYGYKNIQQTSTGGMDCEGNYIYIAQKSNKALQIIGPGP